MTFIDILIILLIGTVIYCYGVYPYAIQVLARVIKRPWKQDEHYEPTISIIVAAHNEELLIGGVLDSLLQLDYPGSQIEIIVGSDGSTDRTNDILRDYAEKDSRIKPYYFQQQRGKMPTLNDAVRHARGEILFFADADLTFSKNTLRAHVRHHIDPQVGIVAGAYQIITNNSGRLGEIETQYASLEQKIRASESKFASTMNVYGGNYSMRRELWRPLPSSMVHDDMYVVFSVIGQGRRVISDRETIAYDKFARSFSDEFARKVRSASRGYPTLSYFPEVIFFQQLPESFLLWSHKILRWLSPFFVAMAVLLALWRYCETEGAVYAIFVFLIGIAIVLGATTYFLERRGRSLPFLGKIGWFIAMNFAYVIGTLRFLTGRDQAAWKKASRAEAT